MNNSFQNGIECRSAGSSDAVLKYDLFVDERDNFDIVTKLPNDLPSVASRKSYVESSDSMKPDCKFNVSEKTIFPVKVIEDDQKGTELSLGNHVDMQRIEVEHNKEVHESKHFNHDASNFLNAHATTKESYHDKQHENIVDLGVLPFVTGIPKLPDENIDKSQTTEFLCPLKSCEYLGGSRKLNENSQVPDVKAVSVRPEEVIQPIKIDLYDKSCTQHLQTPIPSLVSEMSGSYYRKLLDNPAPSPAVSNSAISPKTSKPKFLVASKTGISLDLNVLASAGRDEKRARRQKLACRRHTISSSCTVSSLNLDMKSLHPSLATVAKERVIKVKKDKKIDAQLNKNLYENSTLAEGIGFPQSFPKMKRKIPHAVDETDSCKRCSCKRSKCLKLYCACFAAGVHCVEPCNCQDCFNKPIHDDIVRESRRQIESRKPLAFAPKVIMVSGTPNSGNESNQTPTAATYKCSCKKSRCLKKYCECFQGGVGCSLSCRCESCENSFGLKGASGIAFEKATMPRESAVEAPEKNQAGREHSNNSIGSPVPPAPCGSPEPSAPCGSPVPSAPCGQSLQSCTSLQADDVGHTATVENTM